MQSRRRKRYLVQLIRAVIASRKDDKAEVLLRSRHRSHGRRRDLRLETLKLLLHDVSAEDEIARVPEITVLNERARVCFVGFLHEALDSAHLRVER
jgi:hypothetical protein